MVIDKIINNNIVSSYDDKGRELVVMGRGLGFQSKIGQEINENRIEKIFRMESSEESEKLQAVLADIPLEYIQIADEIIAFAYTVLKNKLSKSIYITLTDHINYAIERYRQGVHFSNALLWEIKKLYQQEFSVGKKALQIIQQRLDIQLSEDEAASITLHIVNAEFGVEMPNTIDITKLIQNVIKIVTYHFQTALNEESINYDRFITHLKFFSQRVITNNNNHGEDEVFHEMIKNQYPEAYQCAEKIKAYIEKEYGIDLPNEEMVYLTIHIKRITMDNGG